MSKKEATLPTIQEDIKLDMNNSNDNSNDNSNNGPNNINDIDKFNINDPQTMHHLDNDSDNGVQIYDTVLT